MREVIRCSKERGYPTERELPFRPPRPDLTVGLKAFDHQIPLGLVLPETPEEPLLLGVVLTDPLQAALDEPIDVSGI